MCARSASSACAAELPTSERRATSSPATSRTADGPALRIQRRIGGGEIRKVRPVQDGRAKGGRFEGRMPPVVHQRSADEAQARRAIPMRHLSHRIGKIDLGRPGHRLVLRADGEAEALPGDQRRNRCTSAGVAGGKDQAGRGHVAVQRGKGGQDRFLLTLVGGGGQKGRGPREGQIGRRGGRLRSLPRFRPAPSVPSAARSGRRAGQAPESGRADLRLAGSQRTPAKSRRARPGKRAHLAAERAPESRCPPNTRTGIACAGGADQPFGPVHFRGSPARQAGHGAGTGRQSRDGQGGKPHDALRQIPARHHVARGPAVGGDQKADMTGVHESRQKRARRRQARSRRHGPR